MFGVSFDGMSCIGRSRQVGRAESQSGPMNGMNSSPECTHVQHSGLVAPMHFYAAHLRRWLVFAGLLDQRGTLLVRPTSTGSRMGLVADSRVRSIFLGT